MASTAKLIQRELDVLQKAKDTHRARVKKLEENEFKRILKFLKQANFFETDFSDSDLQEGFSRMVESKQFRAPQQMTMASESSVS